MLSRPNRKTKARREKEEEPLEVDLTVRFRFGDEPGDTVTMIDNRRIPLVGNVFDSRDAMVRGFVKLLLKAGLTQPKVLGELVPALKMIRKKR